MKTYYYSIKTSHPCWEQEIQYLICLENREEAVKYCRAISSHLKVEIRLCESEGYNNQGCYIYESNQVIIAI